MANRDHELPLRERKKMKLEHKITHCALQLFEKKGYDAVSIDDIAEAADISKGTFYNYFPTKEAVLSIISQNSVNKVKESMLKAPVTEDPIEMIRLCFHYLLDDIYLWRNVAREIALMSVSNEVIHTCLSTLIVGYVDMAQKRGIFRGDYDCESLSCSLMGIYYVAIFGFDSSISKEECKKKLDASYSFMLEGILNHGN